MKKYILLLFLFCLALGNEKNWFTSANIWAHIPGRVVTQNYNLSTTINTLVVPTSFKTDQVLEKTSAHGVSVDGLIIKDGGATVKALTALKADLINETTSAHGVTVDGVLIKDNGAVFGAAVSGITTLTATTLSITAISTKPNLILGLKTDLVDELTSAHGVSIDSLVLIKDGNISGVIQLNVTTVNAANIVGTLKTAAQTNITSVGTLSALNVSTTITSNHIKSNTATITTISATSIAGTLSTAAQPNITSVGTLPAATITVLTVATVNATALSGTLQTAAQPNITSVGTLPAATITVLTSTTGNITHVIATDVIAPTLTGTATTANIGLKVDSGTVFPTATVGRIFLDTSVPAVYISLDGVNWTRFGNFLN